MEPQDFITGLNALRSLGLCSGRMKECQAGFIVFLWMRFGPALVPNTVLTVNETAPSRPTGAESLSFFFAKKYIGRKLSFSSVTYSVGVSGVGSLL